MVDLPTVLLESHMNNAPWTPMPDPPWDDRDGVFGRLMGAWSSLEHALFILFWTLSGSHQFTATAIFATHIHSTAMSELLLSLAEPHVEGKELKSLRQVLERFKRLATTRNRIVHGGWKIQVVAHGVSEDSTVLMNSKWIRYYTPISLEERRKIAAGNEKTRQQYEFTIAKMAETAAQVEKLISDLGTFNNPLMTRLHPDGLPGLEDQVNATPAPPTR